MPAGLVAGLLLLLFGAALAFAPPAAAVDDQTRPEARVVKGPSCSPGGVVIDVVARSTPYSVRLATTRTPSGEDQGTVRPGATLRLRTGDVTWGETIDSRLEYTALDGSGSTFVDELEDYSFTRPSKEDCDAIAAPSSSAPTSAAPSSSAGAGAAAGGPQGTAGKPRTDGGQATTPTGHRAPAPTARPQTADASAWNAGHAMVQTVAGDGAFTLSGTGFQPGERVTVHLHGTGAVLASATAGADGSVRTAIQLPSGTTGSSATVDLVGDRSQVTADVRLQLAAVSSPVTPHGTGDLWALIAAAVALVGTVAGLVSVAGRQRTAARPGTRVLSA